MLRVLDDDTPPPNLVNVTGECGTTTQWHLHGYDLEDGFRQGVTHAMSDGILTRHEEERLRTFRDNLAREDSSADSKTLATLDRASSGRIMMETRLAADLAQVQG